MNKLYFLIWFYILISKGLKEARLLYPPAEYISAFKPLSISPIGSICGLEYKDTLCDNWFSDDQSCSNSNRIIYCDQTCPYGNVVPNLNRLEQLKLEVMNPCVIYKDFSYLMTNSSNSNNSFYFDKTNNLCPLNKNISQWKPFNLELSRARPKFSFSDSRTSDAQVLDSGLSASLWFTQSGSNNGTLLTILQDDNSTVFSLTVQTQTKKIFINYICFTKSDLYPFIEIRKECFIELDAKNLKLKENFLAFRIFKNTFDLFVNEPSEFDESLSFSSIVINYDLGTYFLNNSRKLNFLVGTDSNGFRKYYGWIQDFRIFTISLVNIEIANLYGKLVKTVKIQPQCRCPNDYPRNQNENSTFCLRNRFNRLDFLDKKYRLNEYAHPLSFINDDNFETSWISCILTITNPIEIILDLENGIYLVQRVEIFFSHLPPTNIIIQRFYDNKWFQIQKYSIECDGTNSNCLQLPNKFDNGFFGGYNIIWSTLINDENEFFSNDSLVEGLKASRIKLILSGYYPSVKNDIRKLYYGISELRIRGRCDCNGYSNTCDMSQIPFRCGCEPESNTGGQMCEKCQPLYNNYIYNTRYSNQSATCSKCNCNNRSDKCEYEPNLKKGRCTNCINNSTGLNCEKCIPNYFLNLFLNQCERCSCNLNGVITNIGSISLSYCDQMTGKCFCKQNIEGERCEKCKPGYYDYTAVTIQGCRRCECNNVSTVGIPGTNLTLCDEVTGQCKCKSQYVVGIKCDHCMESMYDLDAGCNKQCNCDPLGSISASCNEFTGQCFCKNKVRGLKCNQCEAGFYNLTSTGCSNRCECNPAGSFDSILCDSITGNCLCKTGYAGKNCDRCLSGYWRSNSQCIKCQCNLNGILNPNNICEEETGRCICNPFTEGFSCDRCKPGYYGLTNTTETCKKCECDSIGTDKKTLVNGNYICDSRTSQCVCNKNRIGIKCESCAVGFFFLNLNGIDCFECACDPAGSIPGSNCDSLTGECVCKVANGIGGTRCDQCSEGFFNFSKTTGSCSVCGCNIAGSYDQNCDLVTGQCNCKDFVTGQKCSVCVPGTSNLDINNPFGCSKSPSKQSPPFLAVKNSSTISITWSPPDYPNGIIRYYLVYRNETQIAKTSKTFYDDTSLEPFIVYSYRIESFNDEGNTSSRLQYITIALPSQPCCRFSYRLFNIRSSEADIIWSIPERLNGLNPLYYIRIYSKINPNKPVNTSSLENLKEEKNSSIILEHNSLFKQNSVNLQSRIKNLNPYTFYYVNIKSCNKDLIDQNKLYCLDGVPDLILKSATGTNFTSFLTSQDRPENQPEPVLISLNSTFIIVGVRNPLKPNGIIILYELWKKSYNSTNMDPTLACTIEDLYDPNDLNQLADNRLKICIIKNLDSRSTYGILVTSSTIIGRSKPSKELLFTTLETPPVCPPKIIQSLSYRYDSVFIKWLPSYNDTLYEPYWINCLGGGIRNFSVYFVGPEGGLVYSGIENSANITKLNYSQNFNYYVELCNLAGCLKSEVNTIRTLDPAPNKWEKDDLNYQIINSSFIKFDWSRYNPYNSSNASDIKFKIERSRISFANPPTLLEAGYRLHGFNFYEFDSDKYYPQGYSFFGIRYNYKSKRDGLIYFAASTYSQSELSATQIYDDKNWFISNTQSRSDQCSIYLQGGRNNQSWSSVKIFRLNSYAFMRSNEIFIDVNSSQCNNQVITDVTGCFIGGLPDNFLSRDESMFSKQEFKKIQKKKLYGCIRNVSTIIEFDTIKFSSNTSIPISKEIEFDFFNDAKISSGEPYKSNTIYGCPLNLDTDSNPFHMLGYGYVFANIRETMPAMLQNGQNFVLNLQFRSEWAYGILYFNYDIDNEQYLLMRLLPSNKLEVCLKTRIRYDLTNNKAFLNYFDLLFNETYGINSISNGYWSNLNLEIDFLNRSLLIQINQTRIVYKNFITNSSVPANFDPKILNASLLSTFYFNSQSFFGGFDLNLLENIYDTLSKPFIQPNTRKFFLGLFNFIEFLNENIYFTGCLKQIRINGFLIDLFNINNRVIYKNVRFDGCPKTEVFIENVTNLIETIIQTNETTGYDSNFLEFTEYFYRVTAFNTQGKSSSEWFLIRTPDGAPSGEVDIERYLEAEALNGYKIEVKNIKNFCFYCQNWSFNSRGVVNKFLLEVNGSNRTQVFEFFCDSTCSSSQLDEQNGPLGNVFKKTQDPRATKFFIDTTPITQYTIFVSICNPSGCIKSDPYQITTLSEIPDGIIPPSIGNYTSNTLLLIWSVPKYPSGNITAYIIRQIEASSENVLYFGLQTSVTVNNLSPLTNYTFVLEACNIIGCGRSQPISYMTGEMAPLTVQPPTILKVTQTVIIIKWSKPSNDQIQFGFLTNYFLYVNDVNYFYNLTSYNISTCTECASNIKDINDLVPGTEYEIRLAACTRGGCTNSSVLKVLTLEGEPNVSDIILEVVNRTSDFLQIKWNKPSMPNGQLNKYVLFLNDKIIYEGNKTEFFLYGLLPSTSYLFYVQFCNFYSCNSTKPVRFWTDEAIPYGNIILEAQAKGSNQIELKWYSDPDNPLKPNGIIHFSVYVTGPFLINTDPMILFKLFKNDTKIIQIQTLNLLNTTVSNTKYGILDRILPYSEYIVQVNASNTKGFILTNQVKVETLTSNPELVIPPQLVYSNSTCLKIEWIEPLLINSEDDIIYYQLMYRRKLIWNQNGSIKDPKYDDDIITLFSNKIMANFYVLYNLTAFTAYSFQLTATNSYGDTKSEWSTDYYTLETTPQGQSQPEIINVTSTSVFLKYSQATEPNGIIILFKINVFKYTNELIHIGVITLKNETTSYNVTNLEAYTNYLFVIESCNSLYCAQSKYDKFKPENNNYTKTLPDIPQGLKDPILTSPNSYSVEIKWSPPVRINGDLEYYVLERHDFSSISNSNLSRKYKFSGSKSKFLDDMDLQPCGVYSYRILAFNQIGFTASDYVNVTVAPAKPLVVTSPVVYLINSSNGRFEWNKPLSFCNIAKYILNIKSDRKSFSVDVPSTDQSVIVSNLSAFTVYKVSLTACVSLIKDSCSSSLAKNFRTPGFAPEGLYPPVVKLLSPKAVSVEWLDPDYINGESLNYQVLRQNLRLNRTENMYSGRDMYFLDLRIKNYNSYRYKIAYINEFGSSFSDWSTVIEIENSEPLVQDDKIRYIFNLIFECRTSNIGIIKWSLQKNEVLNFLRKLFNVKFIAYEELSIKVNEDLFIFDEGFDANEKMVYLNESSDYQVELVQKIRTDSDQTYYLISEKKTCRSPSLEQTFNNTKIEMKKVGSQLSVTYSLGYLIVENYEKYEFMFNKSTQILNQINVTKASGNFLVGPVIENEVYFLTLKACTKNICTYFKPVVYSISTKAPRGISNLTLALHDLTSVKISWEPVQEPNGFGINYLLYRRLGCIDEQEVIKDCPKGKVCCGPNEYDPKPGYECCANFYYVSVPDGQICCSNTIGTDIRYTIGTGNDCCNDIPFFNTSTQYCCSSTLKNEIFDTQKQCSYFPEINKCQEFILLVNQTKLVYLDENLNSSTIYEYNLCAENSYGQACSIDNYKIKTQVIPPENFTVFKFKVLNERSVYLSWEMPIYPNDESNYFILSRNSLEVYKGEALNFEDMGLKPFEKYLYTVKSCNSVGCTQNRKKLFLSTVTKKPDDIQVNILEKFHSNFTLEWQLAYNIIEKFVFLIPECDLEYEFYFNFESKNVNYTISAKDQNQKNDIYFSTDSLLHPGSIYQLTVVDLKPNLEYSYQIIACNNAGCSKSEIGKVKMDAYEIKNFSAPILYALNESSIELVWWEPEVLNGDLEYYKIFRNNLEISRLKPSKSDFYTFTDLNLKSNERYDYKIQVSNQLYTLDSETKSVRTPANSNFSRCNNDTKRNTNVIYLLNILKINMSEVSKNYINITYDNSDWRTLVACMEKTLSFAIKILILSDEKGVQTIDFPYPNINETITKFRLVGLKPNMNYSIRYLINSNYPIVMSSITEALFIKTLGEKPIGNIEKPIVRINKFSNTISIKWTMFQNNIDYYEILWSRSDCINRQYQNTTLKNQNKQFFYDKTNELFIYKYPNESPLFFNSIKITGVNKYGFLSSQEESFLTRGPKPLPVYDIKVAEIFSTGIRIRFKSKNYYMAYFLVQIEPLFEKFPNKTQQIIVPVELECRILDFYEAVINGLEPYSMYNLTVKAVSFSYIDSDISEFLIVNTLESTPKNLKPLIYQPKSNSISFKFSDPEFFNGILKQFILYSQSIIYNGKEREFVYENLNSFKNYSFNYEVCTMRGCSRYRNDFLVQTLESLPDKVDPPLVDKVDGCFKILVKIPLKINGIYRYTEVYRSSKVYGTNQLLKEILIKNLTQIKSINDCNVTANILYSYRSVVYNSIGGVSSEPTEYTPIEFLKPTGFEQISATQLNETCIRIDFDRPKDAYSENLIFKIYRNSDLIFTIPETNNLSISFFDLYDFVPNIFIKYSLYACNVIGCSTGENYSILIRTKNLPPILVYRPLLVELGPNFAKIDASLSVILRQNQKVVEYRFYLNQILVSTSLIPNVIIENLIPNREYKMILEVCTFLPDGCLKSKEYLHFRTLQVVPVLNFEPSCVPRIRSLLVQWAFIEQDIDQFLLKYRQANLEYINIVIDSNKYSTLIDQLVPFTKYEIIIGGCNKAGCGYSKPTICQTLKNLPDNITIDIKDMIEGDLLIKWSISNEFKSEDFEFMLWRNVVSSGLVYDSSFNPLKKEKKLVYSGKETMFIDRQVDFFTEYAYYVEINSIFGVVKSQVRLFKTRASAPQLIILIGSIHYVGNDFVNIMIRPPLKINGLLMNINVVVKTGLVETEKELLHSNISLLNESELINFLNNVTVRDLIPDSVYELKTKFCNQVSCLTSLQSIKFKTLSEKRIEFFNAVSEPPNSIKFKWSFKNSDSNKKNKFQLRYINFGTNLVLYEGYEENFVFQTTKPMTTYEFELIVFDESDNNWIIDRKTTKVTTLKDKSVINEGPVVNLFIQENRTTIFDINWENFSPYTDNYKNTTYELIVNNFRLYSGKFKSLYKLITVDECSRLLGQRKEFFIQIKALVDENVYLAEPLLIPFNCPIQSKEEKLINFNKSLIFIFPAFLLVLLIVTIFCCINKYRSTNSELSISSSTLSLNSSNLQNLFMEKNKSFLAISQSNTLRSRNNPIIEKSKI